MHFRLVIRFRHYSDEIEALAARWRAMLVTGDRWKVIGKASAVKGVAGSESARDIAQCGPLNDLMKPGENTADDKYRAGQEKIAIGYWIRSRYCRSAVILWDRGSSTSQSAAAVDREGIDLMLSVWPPVAADPDFAQVPGPSGRNTSISGGASGFGKPTDFGSGVKIGQAQGEQMFLCYQKLRYFET
jgi:hypothetical protein